MMMNIPVTTLSHGYADPERKYGYYLVKFLFRLSMTIFYSDVETAYIDRFPREGPTIVAANHTNSLIDAVVTLSTAPRDVRLTCKDTLLEEPIFGVFVRNVESIGVKRKMDYNNAEVNNTDAFAAVMTELGKGCCVGLFPEGMSRYQSNLSPFKTGVARMCVDFVCEQHQRNLTNHTQGSSSSSKYDYINIVSYGITYLHRDRFRSAVGVLIGEPLRIDKQKLRDYGLDLDIIHSYNEKDIKTLKFKISERLTQELRTSFDELTITAPQWHTICLAHLARDIAFPNSCIPSHTSLPQYIDITRQLNQLLLKKSQDQEVEDCEKELDRYWNMLYTHKITDQCVRTRIFPYVHSQAYIAMRMRAWLNLSQSLLQCGVCLIVAAPAWIMGLPILLSWKYHERSKIAMGIQKNYDDCAQLKVTSLFFGSLLLQALYTGATYKLLSKYGNFSFLSSSPSSSPSSSSSSSFFSKWLRLEELSHKQISMATFVLWPCIMWCGVYAMDELMANVRTSLSLWKVLWFGQRTCEELVSAATTARDSLLSLVTKYNIKEKKELKKNMRTNNWSGSRLFFKRNKNYWNETLSSYDLPPDTFHILGFPFLDFAP